MHLVTAITLVNHRGKVVVMCTFNSSTKEEYQMGGDRSQAQSHFEDSWGQDHPFLYEVEVRISAWQI